MSEQVICVLGGTGFVGRHLVSRLAERQLRVKVLTRRPERHRGLLVLPTIRLIEADVHDPTQLRRHFQGCDTVINLVGILNERGHDGAGFQRAHVELARAVITACRRAGVRRLLQMSALGADAATGPSFYSRSKGAAEDFVHARPGEHLSVTSFRPSVIFGPDDSFINRFAGLLRFSPVLPLACPNARFAPVYVGDVVDAFEAALRDRTTFGRRIDLCGPHNYTLLEVVRYIARVMDVRRLIIGLPARLSRAQANLLEYVPGKPFSLDNYRSLTRDSVCVGAERCPTSLESVVPGYLGRR
ncbi:MAG: complex I NDUFA9 subunit family protein [Gammaproteobacteria bacterium]